MNQFSTVTFLDSPGFTQQDVTAIQNRWANLSSDAQEFCAQSHQELVDRVLLVDRLYQTGELQQEIKNLGLRVKWLDKLHQEPLRVVISEQQQPLTSLYSAIDQYGHPDALRRGLAEMQCLKMLLEKQSNEDVETGMLISKSHGVSFQGISFGGYFVVPQINSENLNRISLFTKKEKKDYGKAAYNDLLVSEAQSNQLLNEIKKIIKDATQKLNKANRKLNYNENSNTKDETHADDLSGTVKNLGFFVQGLTNLAEDWKSAFEEQKDVNSNATSVPYVPLISTLNEKLAARFDSKMSFNTFANDTVDEVLSTGIEDWPTFIKFLTDSGLIKTGDTIARWRTTENGHVKYMNVRLSSFEPDRIIVGLKMHANGSETFFDIKELSRISAENLISEEPPLLTPSAEIRYLLNLGYSRSLVLYDGMPYKRILKAIDLLKHSSLLLHNRAPKLHSYSDLSQFTPANPEEPWNDLRELHHSAQYYMWAEELGVSSKRSLTDHA